MRTGTATIVDNRDGSTETVYGVSDTNNRDASINAFRGAVASCAARNEREGWMRFVPLRFEMTRTATPHVLAGGA